MSSDRPPARSMTEAPYARLNDARVQTGPRPKIPQIEETPVPAEEETATAPEETRAPDSLRRPYATLTPSRRASASDPPRSTNRPSAANDATEVRRWNDTTEMRRRLGNCQKHRIARAPNGECLLCKKEQPKPSSRNGLVFLVVGLVVTLAISLAAFL